MDTGNLHVVAVEEFGEFLRGPVETVAIPLHKSFRRGGSRGSRRTGVRMNAGAEKEDEDEEAREGGRTGEVATRRKRRKRIG